MGCGASGTATDDLDAYTTPEETGKAVMVALFGADLVEGVLEQLPVVKNILGLIHRMREKYNDRKNMLKWLEALQSFAVYFGNSFEILSNEEDKALVKDALEEARSTLEASVLTRAGRLAEPKEALEEIRDVCKRLETTCNLVNFRMALPDRQQPRTRLVADIKADKLAVLEQIGQGMFHVHKEMLSQIRKSGVQQQKLVAVKIYEGIAPMDKDELLKRVETNAQLQMSVAHSNILRILGICSDHYGYPGAVLLVTQLLPLGSLHAAIHANTCIAEDVQRAHWALTSCLDSLMGVLYGVASALHHMHSRAPPLLHLDLKSANVLLEELPSSPDGRMHLRALVCDFDASKDFTNFRSSTSASTAAGLGKHVKGTYAYMSPERLRAADGCDAPSADVYAFGMLVVEAVNAQMPFEGLDVAQIVTQVLIVKEKPCLDKAKLVFHTSYADIVDKCLAEQPADRLTMAQVIACLQWCMDKETTSCPVPSHPIHHISTVGMACDSAASGSVAGESSIALASATTLQKCKSSVTVEIGALIERTFTGWSKWGRYTPYRDIRGNYRLDDRFLCDARNTGPGPALELARKRLAKVQVQLELLHQGDHLNRTGHYRDASDPVPDFLEVVCVQQAFNPDRMSRYNACKQRMLERYHGAWADGCSPRPRTSEQNICRLDERINEVYLWHGTSPDNARSIMRDNFDMQKAGSTHGASYGRGAYLAESCLQADEYTSDEDGSYPFILSRVLLGKIKVCSSSDQDTDKIEKGFKRGDFDSVLGDREQLEETYREYIVYDSAQVFPEFLVWYQKRFTGYMSDIITEYEFKKFGGGETYGSPLCLYQSHLHEN